MSALDIAIYRGVLMVRSARFRLAGAAMRLARAFCDLADWLAPELRRRR